MEFVQSVLDSPANRQPLVVNNPRSAFLNLDSSQIPLQLVSISAQIPFDELRSACEN